jgi:hypothetical protein
MPVARMLVYTNPTSEADLDAFNEWYDTVHIPEVIEKVDGVTGAERFLTTGSGRYRSLAVYDLDAEDPSSIPATLGRLMQSGQLTVTPALAPDALIQVLVAPQ